jgi:hypothetical protein
MPTNTNTALHLLLIQLMATWGTLFWEMLHNYFAVDHPQRVNNALLSNPFEHVTKGKRVLAGTAIITLSLTLPFFSQAFLHLPNFTTLAMVLVSIRSLNISSVY